MKPRSTGILWKLILDIIRGILIFLLCLTVVRSPNVNAQMLPTLSAGSVHDKPASETDDETAINELIKTYFRQYAAATKLRSLTLLGLTIEKNRAYAVGLVREPAPDGKTTRMNTIGFILERIEASKWSIQPANRAISVQEINLSVPFTPQVPPGDWINSTNCGQAVLAMMFSYYGFFDHTPANSADIIAINTWLAQAYSNKYYSYDNGYYTTTEILAYTARNYAHYIDSYADENADWTPDRIKQEILAGRPVIVATYTNMDMVKSKRHLMVVRGVRLDVNGNVTQVIVNDPAHNLISGRGENYIYDVATFETAWARNNRAIVMIIPSPPPPQIEQKTHFQFRGNGY